MVNPHEISSTEKLLNLIRTKGDGTGSISGVDSSPDLTRTGNNDSAGALECPRPGISRRKGLTVGIDIGKTDIKLVAVGPKTDKQPKLVNWASFPLEPGVATDSGKLGRVLKTAMSGFCVRNGKTELWACISSSNVETRALKIPKVVPKQMANAVLWAFRKEAVFSEKTDILDFHVIGEVVEDNTAKLQIMASTAPRQEVDSLKRLFARSGYPLTGISIVPFALENLFGSGWVPVASEDVCTLFAGKDQSRINIFSKGRLMLSRDIKTGMKSLVQSLSVGIESRSDEMAFQVREIDGDGLDSALPNIPTMDFDQAQRLLDAFMEASAEKDLKGFSENDIFEMIRPALDRILRQVEMTAEHYHQNFSNRRVGRLFISGPISGPKLINGYFQDQLDFPVESIDPFDRLLRSPGVTPPSPNRRRTDFIPATGLALSRIPQTPNFLFTYKDKARKRIVRRFDAAILTFFVLVLIAFGGLYQWLDHQHTVQDKRIEALRSELDRFAPQLNQGLLLDLAAQTASKMNHLAAIGKRYHGMAMVNEIARLTPEKIKLLRLTANLGPPQKPKAARSLVLDGIVTGDGKMFDAILAQYVIELGKSSLFETPSIDQQHLETVDGVDVLRFALSLKLV